MRDVIYFINLIQEIQDFGTKLPQTPTPKITCRVFEDNVGALELANAHKLRPRTKHLSVQLHHFRQRVWTRQCSQRKLQRQINGPMFLPKPCLVMLFDTCEEQSSAGKTLRGSVMNIKFMMESIYSCNVFCEFPRIPATSSAIG